MLSFHLDYAGFDDAVQSFHDFAYRLFDLRPLAERIAMIAMEQNLLQRDIGHDQYDNPFIALAPSTMKRRIRQGRLGPPLAPDSAASDIVGSFRADIEVIHPDQIVVRCHWPGIPWVGYHLAPHGTRPVRDAVGLAPHAQAQMASEFEDFIAGLLASTY